VLHEGGLLVLFLQEYVPDKDVYQLELELSKEGLVPKDNATCGENAEEVKH